MKKYDLPSLSALHTFEVVARKQSFTLAAHELSLTQSAVSRQIRTLETAIGRPLFRRRHRAIELTSEARQLFGAVTRGLDEISACLQELRQVSPARQITVAASVAFSYYVLMPLLERFSGRFPEVDLRVLATDQVVDLHRGVADVAILYGEGNWTGLATRRLFGEQVYPVCSPAYRQDHPELLHATNLLDQTLLHLEGDGNIWGAVDWQTWLLERGVIGQPVRRAIRLNSYPMVLHGAESGRGVALGWSYITEPMLAEGRLVRPVEGVLETQKAYYVGASVESLARSEIAGFVDWILNEISEDRSLA